MPVYVDELTETLPFQRKRWKHDHYCHLTADTEEELHSIAEKIGLRRSYFQKGTPAHYDLTKQKREEAIEAGAIFKAGKEQARDRLYMYQLANSTIMEYLNAKQEIARAEILKGQKGLTRYPFETKPVEVYGQSKRVIFYVDISWDQYEAEQTAYTDKLKRMLKP